jgi:hypothetical protein
VCPRCCGGSTPGGCPDKGQGTRQPTIPKRRRCALVVRL